MVLGALRALRVALVAVLLAGVVISAPAAPAAPAAGPTPLAGPFRYTEPTTKATRQYFLHVPPNARRNAPLVVYLHGCVQTAPQAAAATGFGALADKHGFVVAYPQQNVTAPSSAPLVDGNGIGCWNWFLPDNHARDKGEPAVIAGMTRHLMAEYRSDARRVYVAGISAGANLAVTLAATYPDLYAAAAAHEGCAYATCTDVSGTLAHRAMAERARVVPMFVMQGTADTLNVYPLAQGLVSSWLGTGDWIDDGAANGSISRAPARVEHRGTDQSPSPGSGDPCVRSQNWPCPGGIVGFRTQYPHSIARFNDGKGCGILDFWVIHGMAHSQPNAKSGPFTDPLGPDVTAATYDFFRQRPKGACAKT